MSAKFFQGAAEIIFIVVLVICNEWKKEEYAVAVILQNLVSRIILCVSQPLHYNLLTIWLAPVQEKEHVPCDCFLRFIVLAQDMEALAG